MLHMSRYTFTAVLYAGAILAGNGARYARDRCGALVTAGDGCASVALPTAARTQRPMTPVERRIAKLSRISRADIVAPTSPRLPSTSARFLPPPSRVPLNRPLAVATEVCRPKDMTSESAVLRTLWCVATAAITFAVSGQNTGCRKHHNVAYPTFFVRRTCGNRHRGRE